MRPSPYPAVPTGGRLPKRLWPVVIVAVALVAAFSRVHEEHCPDGDGVPVPAPLSMLAHLGAGPSARDGAAPPGAGACFTGLRNGRSDPSPADLPR
ncbi:hypothetical protein [Actinomadura fibrosa]|uniref:Uncharacterized protein n=1 Tax=Actinomadura fibrosa TaxID=111802 RepID=A0ABW2XCT9_9ACTN|nr:hypothetical protein [Actinomadura fibrosa]